MSETTPRRANRAGRHNAASSNASMTSSLSSSTSSSAWSMPRSRGSGQRYTGPKRDGTSFRVSLRPASHRKRHGQKKQHDGNQNETSDEDSVLDCLPEWDLGRQAVSASARRILLGLVLMSLIGSTIFLMQSPLAQTGMSMAKKKQYELYNSHSIEERVAQDELRTPLDLSPGLEKNTIHSNVYKKGMPSNVIVMNGSNAAAHEREALGTVRGSARPKSESRVSMVPPEEVQTIVMSSQRRENDATLPKIESHQEEKAVSHLDTTPARLEAESNIVGLAPAAIQTIASSLQQGGSDATFPERANDPEEQSGTHVDIMPANSEPESGISELFQPEVDTKLTILQEGEKDATLPQRANNPDETTVSHDTTPASLEPTPRVGGLAPAEVQSALTSLQPMETDASLPETVRETEERSTPVGTNLASLEPEPRDGELAPVEEQTVVSSSQLMETDAAKLPEPSNETEEQSVSRVGTNPASPDPESRISELAPAESETMMNSSQRTETDATLPQTARGTEEKPASGVNIAPAMPIAGSRVDELVPKVQTIASSSQQTANATGELERPRNMEEGPVSHVGTTTPEAMEPATGGAPVSQTTPESNSEATAIGTKEDSSQTTESAPASPTAEGFAHQKAGEAPSERIVVAYVLPIFTCYPRGRRNFYGTNGASSDETFHDAAVMLQASVHQNSVRNPTSGSVYDYEMVALIHEDVIKCQHGKDRVKLLESVGYKVHTVQEPIQLQDLKDQHLRLHAPNTGEVGMKELIRLHAFTLVDYPIVTMVDITSFVLHPPDAIYNLLLHGAQNSSWAEEHPEHIVRSTYYANGTITTMESLPSNLDILITRDFSMIAKGQWTTGISLGFIPLRPSLELYKELIETYKSSSFHPEHGWASKGYALFPGALTTKGLLTYYFNEVRYGSRLELHRCVYHNMADVPYIHMQGTPRQTSTQCRDVRDHKKDANGKSIPCTDCRKMPFDDVVVANMAVCRSPWSCPYIKLGGRFSELVTTTQMCRRFHHSWFALRQVVEDYFLEPSQRTEKSGTFHPDLFMGYCSQGGVYTTMKPSVTFENGLIPVKGGGPATQNK